MNSAPGAPVTVRNTRPDDVAAIQAVSRRVYPASPPWSEEQLQSHLRVFPEGQLLAECEGQIVGMAASLVVRWDDYDFDASWRDFTAAGHFTNHDPEAGRTLYGAEVMVDPQWQGRGVGSALYEARRAMVESLGLRRIRAGARLRGYHRVAESIAASEYVRRVIAGEISDPTLSFQLRRSFKVLAVVSGYLRHDPESLGWAAVIEWLNPGFREP